MEFISTKDMQNDQAPEGKCLVQYLEPFFGGLTTEFGIGYFDNPNDYGDPSDGEGWKLWETEKIINVIAYIVLDDKLLIDTGYGGSDGQRRFMEEHNGILIPNLGNVGK